MAIQSFTVTAPSYWATYYVNADSSGLTDDEIKAADDFHDWLAKNVPNLSCVNAQDAGFVRFHDAFSVYPYPADCSTYTFLVCEVDVVLEQVVEKIEA